jgi:hypothetical protein
MPYEHGQGWALGYSRWDDKDLDEVFGAPPSSPKYGQRRESLLALEAGEAVGGHLFVTLSEDLLANRDWLQDRMTVFIVGLSEALYFLDVHLKRRGIYAYRASSHVAGKQGYYFKRVCESIPNFPIAWTTSLFGEGEIPTGQSVQRYLESLHLRLVPMFEIKDRIADLFYTQANNDTQYLMLREMNMFFPLVTGSFDSLAWLCRYLYQFRPQKTEEDWELRRRVVLKLPQGQELINHIEQANKPLGELLRSDAVQKLLEVFYPTRDSIQHRHPLAGVQYIWVEDRGLGIIPRAANEKAYSLALLDEDTAQAIGALDQDDASDYFTQWGLRTGGSSKLLEPHKFITQALNELRKFYDGFFQLLGLPSHQILSEATKQSVQAVEKERRDQYRHEFALPFFLDRDIPIIAGGLAQATTMKSGYGSVGKAADKRSQALLGTHTVIIDMARIGNP